MSLNLLEIKSRYILKSIFSFLDYDHSLKLIKNNKKYQKILGINIQNYKERSNYEYEEKEELFLGRHAIICCRYPNMQIFRKRKILIINFEILTIISTILFIYVLIFASLLAAKGTFNQNNTKKNYDKNIAKVINRINKSLFVFLVYILLSYFLLLIFFKRKYRNFFFIFNEIIYINYIILIIIKLILSYKIKQSKITWFMYCDYVLIVFIFIYITFFLYIIYYYIIKNFCEKRKIPVSKSKKLALIKFRDVEIYDFELPKIFKSMNDYEKREYVLKNKNEYEIKFTVKQEDMLFSINKLRKNNNIDPLFYDYSTNFRNLIIDKYSEHIFCNYENIFKLANGNYLLKYPVNEFITKFNNKDDNIIKIILNDYFENIVIVEKNNMEYFYIFHKQEELFEHKDTIREKIRFKDSNDNVTTSNEIIENTRVVN